MRRITAPAVRPEGGSWPIARCRGCCTATGPSRSSSSNFPNLQASTAKEMQGVAPALGLASPVITTETPTRPTRTASDEDVRLARACAEGDTGVFEQIYREHGERMKSIAYNHLGNFSDAEDAVQETFLKVHRAASTYTGEAAFSTWLYRVLINTCYDALRKKQRRIQEAPIDAFIAFDRAGQS